MSPIYKHTIHKNKDAKPGPKAEPKKAEKKEPKAKKK